MDLSNSWVRLTHTITCPFLGLFDWVITHKSRLYMTTMVHLCFCFECSQQRQNNRKTSLLSLHYFTNLITFNSDFKLINQMKLSFLFLWCSWFSRGTVTNTQYSSATHSFIKKALALSREWHGGKGSHSGTYIHPSGRPPDLFLVTLKKTDLTQHTTRLSSHDGVMMEVKYCEKYK